MMRRWVTCLALCLLTSRLVDAGEVFDLKGLLKNADEHYFFHLLDHPQVACHLRHLLSKENLERLRERLHGELARHVLNNLDKSGGYVFTGWVPHSAVCDTGIVWVHPKGGIVGGFDEDCGPPQLFTNDKRLKGLLPAPISEWLESREEWETFYKSVKRKAPPEWVSEGTPSRTPPDCTQAALQKPLAEYQAAITGKACNAFSFSGFVCLPAMIQPEGEQNKASFFSEATECSTEPCPQRRKAYLVLGDLVIHSHTKNRFACAHYRNEAGESFIGWIRTKEIWNIATDLPREITKEIAKKAQERLKSLPHEVKWNGQWRNARGSLNIRAENAESIYVVGGTSHGVHYGEVDNPFKVEGRVAYLEPKEAEWDCGLMLFRLNNALLARDNGKCGGYGVSFDGAYYLSEAHETNTGAKSPP